MDRHHRPLIAIENIPQDGDALPEKILHYNRYMKKARDSAEAGRPKESLEYLNKAAAINKTDKVLKRIEKVKAFLAANSDSEEDDNGLVHVGKGFHIMTEVHKKLYPYQRECLLWFWRLHRNGKGGILGDDMGLGKTIQVVAFLTGLFDMQQVRSVMIVLPVAVIINWEREFEKWAPGINVQCFHGSSKREKERALSKVQRRGGVLLTSYGLVLTSSQQMIQSNGREFNWDYIILDEGHKIKNPGKTTKAIHSVPAKHRFILTGTPVQNNLKEMWALFDFVTHGCILGTIKTFMMEYGNPITRARESDSTASEKLLGNEMSESLRNLIEPYFLRRTKADVLEREDTTTAEQSESQGSTTDGICQVVADVPRLTRKNDFIIWLYLTETQIQIYKDFTQLDQVKELLMSTRSPLAELTVLKKLCDHPRLLSARACHRLGLQTVENMEVHSDSDENSTDVTDAKEAACNIKDIDDEILMAESGKIQFLLVLLHNLTAEGHRTLVFSQSRKMLDIVEKILINQNFKYMRLDGTVSKLTDREQRINRFQSNQSYTVFLLTTQVGGVGLTLTGADRVVIIDPSWNPATDNQAVDRAYRIGQTKSVVVYRLITCSTVEEKIYRRQIFKDSITKQATGASKNPYRYFSRQDLRELFILDDPKRSKTQEQLEMMHSANRKSDSVLDKHIQFLHSLDYIYGISDHDLMFSQEAGHEENEGFEAETENYIQKRVQRAQELVSAESDLTVKLKEQLNSMTQPPGLHSHPSEINTDRARLKKVWEQVHGEPDDKRILKPGADYEERYVCKKIPDVEDDIGDTSTIIDDSEEEEAVDVKDDIGGTNITIDDSEEEIEAVDVKDDIRGLGGDAPTNASSDPQPAPDRPEQVQNTDDYLDIVNKTSSIVIEDSEEEEVEAADGEKGSSTDEDGSEGEFPEAADFEVQCDLGTTVFEDTDQELSGIEQSGPVAFGDGNRYDGFDGDGTRLSREAASPVVEDELHNTRRESFKKELSRKGGIPLSPIRTPAENLEVVSPEGSGRKNSLMETSLGELGTSSECLSAGDVKGQDERGGYDNESTDIKRCAYPEMNDRSGVNESSEMNKSVEKNEVIESGKMNESGGEMNGSWKMNDSDDMKESSEMNKGSEERRNSDLSTLRQGGRSEDGSSSVVRKSTDVHPSVGRAKRLFAPSDRESGAGSLDGVPTSTPNKLRDYSSEDSDDQDKDPIVRRHTRTQKRLVVDSEEEDDGVLEDSFEGVWHSGPELQKSRASIMESDADISAIEESFQEVMKIDESDYEAEESTEGLESFKEPSEKRTNGWRSEETKNVRRNSSLDEDEISLPEVLVNDDVVMEEEMQNGEAFFDAKDNLVSRGNSLDGKRQEEEDRANKEESSRELDEERDKAVNTAIDDSFQDVKMMNESDADYRYQDAGESESFKETAGEEIQKAMSNSLVDEDYENSLPDVFVNDDDAVMKVMPNDKEFFDAKDNLEETPELNNHSLGQEEAEEEEDSWREDDEMEEDDYACSEELDEDEQERYYQCLEKGEEYLELGKKTKALKCFLLALDIDSTSQPLQLRAYTIAKERQEMKAQSQQP